MNEKFVDPLNAELEGQPGLTQAKQRNCVE